MIAEKLKRLREKNSYSVKELACILKVNEKNVMNWEKGILKPDIKILKKLSILYNEPISSFISEDKMINELISNKHKQLILNVLILILLILTLVFGSLFVHREKNEKIEIYKFSGESNNFKFDNGLIILSTNNRYIYLSGFEIKSGIEVKSATINIAFNETLWVADEYNDEQTNVKDWFSNLNYSEYLKNYNLSEKTDNSFYKYKTQFPKDFKVEVNYCTINDDCTVEILSIESESLNVKSK